jgi:hypothetical protein
VWRHQPTSFIAQPTPSAKDRFLRTAAVPVGAEIKNFARADAG